MIQPITLNLFDTALFVALCVSMFIIADVIQTFQREIDKMIIGLKRYLRPKCKNYEGWIGMNFWSIYPDLDPENLMIPMKRESETIFC